MDFLIYEFINTNVNSLYLKFNFEMLHVSKKHFTFVKHKKIDKNKEFHYSYSKMKDRIKQIMESQHMTQQTFAGFLGISSATISSIFQGRTNPTLKIVEQIKSKIPNIQTEWLLFGKGTMFQEDASVDIPSSTPQEISGNEPMFSFSDDEAASKSVQNFSQPQVHNAPINQMANPAQPYSKPKYQPVQTDVIYKDKERRRITEIRVFYDDQTWESFVPKK